jgi:hypothetical protein
VYDVGTHHVPHLLKYNIMKKLSICLLCLLFAVPITAQNYFSKYFNEHDQNKILGYAMTKGVEIAPQKYQVAFHNVNLTTYRSSFSIATLNELGDTILVKTYKTYRILWINNVLKKQNSLYYSGSMYDTVAKKDFFFLMKVNFEGDTIWMKRYALLYNSGACSSMIQTSDQGFIISGNTNSYDSTTQRYGFGKTQVIKLDSVGNLVWSKFYGFSTNTSYVIRGLVETPEKDIIYVGIKHDFYPSFEEDYQYYLFKTDKLGNLIWEKYNGNRDWLEGYLAIIKTKDGNYLLLGGTNYEPLWNTNTAIRLTKINRNGDTLWNKEYLKGNIANAVDIYETDDGKILFTGWIYRITNTPLQSAGLLYKVNAQGDSLWARFYDPDTVIDENIGHLNQTSDKGFILTGTGSPPGSRLNGEAWILKVDSLGCTYNGCAINTATHENTEGSPLMTLFPNPASDVLTIGFKTTALVKNAQLKITDILGRQAKNIPFETLPTEYEIDVGSLSNGTYFCTFMSEGRVLETKKFSVIK